MDVYWTIAVSLLVVLLYRYLFSHVKERKIPGPKGYPIIGSALQVKPGKIHEIFSEFARQYGAMFEVQMFNANILVLNSADMVNKAFRSKGHFFNDRPKFFLGEYLDIQQTISFRNADREHNYLKKSFVKGLHVYGSGIPNNDAIIKHEIDRVMEQLKGLKGEDFEVTGFIQRSITNVMSILVSRTEEYMMRDMKGISGEPATDDDVDALTSYLDLLSWISELDFMIQFTNTLLTFLLSFVNIPFYKQKMDKILLVKQKLFDKYFHIPKESRTSGTIRGLTDWFLHEQQENTEAEHILTDRMIQAIVLSDALGAGSQTTAIVLTSIILCLANHPGYQTKLQEELERVIGDNREPTVSDRHECPFTEAVIMETMRYITPVPFLLPHECSEETEFEGFIVKANTQVLANVWYIHHDESIWGDPWTFRPERFLEDDGKLLPNSHVYMKSWLPFGIGRRRCPGMGLATTRIFLYLTTMLQRWTFVPSPGKCGKGDPRGDDFYSELVFKPKPFYCVAKHKH